MCVIEKSKSSRYDWRGPSWSRGSASRGVRGHQSVVATAASLPSSLPTPSLSSSLSSGQLLCISIALSQQSRHIHEAVIHAGSLLLMINHLYASHFFSFFSIYSSHLHFLFLIADHRGAFDFFLVQLLVHPA